MSVTTRSLVLATACGLCCGLSAAEAAEPEPTAPEPAEEAPPPATDNSSDGDETAADDEEVIEFVAPPNSSPAATTADTGGDDGGADPFSGRARLFLGYDTNVAALPERDDVSEVDSAHIGLDARGVYQRHWTKRNRFRAIGTIGYDLYPDAENYDLLRVGLAANQLWGDQPWMPNITASFNHYRLDGEGVLNAIGVAGGVAKILNPRHITTANADIRYLGYDADPLSGVRLQVRAGHWFLLTPSHTHRRIEADLRLTQYSADADSETYFGIAPGLTWRYRWLAGLGDRQTDLYAGLHLDYRDYDSARIAGGEAENSTLLDLSVGGSWAYSELFTFGASMRYSERFSNIDSRDYDRFRFDVEAAYSF